MKQLAIIIALAIAGILAWFLGSRLSSDALGMAVGLLFGVLAGVPTALLVLVSGRRRRDQGEEREEQPYRYAPAVIVLAAPVAAVVNPERTAIVPVPPAGYQTPRTVDGSYTWVPNGDGTYTKRTFRVVGEKEEYLDEW